MIELLNIFTEIKKLEILLLSIFVLFSAGIFNVQITAIKGVIISIEFTKIWQWFNIDPLGYMYYVFHAT